MDKLYQPIRPKVLRSGSDSHEVSKAQIQQPIPKRRRLNTRVACNRCRLKRIACDGERPACRPCSDLNVCCEYVTNNKDEGPREALQNQLQAAQGELAHYTEILDQLRSAPETEIVTILYRLRAMPGFAAASTISARTAQQPTILPALPAADNNMSFGSTLPPWNTQSIIATLDFSSIDIDIFSKENLYSTTRIEPAMMHMNMSNFSDMNTNESVNSKPFLYDNTYFSHGRTEGVESVVTGPSQDSYYCDTRLRHLDVTYWTTVPISNELATRVISNYLENHHPLTGFFDADLLLGGLTDNNPEHCTAFLFNTLLCQACLGYSVIDSRVVSFSLDLFHESTRLWRAQRSHTSLIALAAINLLSGASWIMKKDELAHELFSDSRRIFLEMQALETQNRNPTAEPAPKMTIKQLRATAQVAWSTYSWLSLCSIVFLKAPALSHPTLPISYLYSSTKNDGNHSATGPPSAFLSPMFPQLCNFWKMYQQILGFYSDSRVNSGSLRIPLAFAEQKFYELFSLADKLNQDYKCGQYAMGHILLFHILYHIAVLDLFRPFVPRQAIQKPITSSSSKEYPGAIFDHSKTQLWRAVSCYSSHGLSINYSPWFTAVDTHIRDAVLRYTDDTG